MALKNPTWNAAVWLTSGSVTDISSKSVADFISEASATLFYRLGIDTSFLDKELPIWPTDAAAKKVNSLLVAIDFAEKGVVQVQECSTILTNDEDQKQCLLHVVEEETIPRQEENNYIWQEEVVTTDEASASHIIAFNKLISLNFGAISIRILQYSMPTLGIRRR